MGAREWLTGVVPSPQISRRLRQFFQPHSFVNISTQFGEMPEVKSIALTGASRGIGLAIARFLLKKGHNVFLIARSEEPLQKLQAEFKGQVEYLASDLSDFEVSCLLLISP